MFSITNGDCINVMKSMDDNSVDSIVSDPPYGLGFMGREWDHGVPGVDFWVEALRVAKPGAFLLAFGGTRTYHRLAVAIEDAGWEIRDGIGWLYGSGFPKSHNISKAIDKAAGAERKVVGSVPQTGAKFKLTEKLIDNGGFNNHDRTSFDITEPSTDDAKKWDGWGTALKPAWEPVIVARKPFKGTVANNVLKYGTGGINIDGCRVGSDLGRFPANIIHDGSDEVLEVFPYTKSSGGSFKKDDYDIDGGNTSFGRGDYIGKNDSGSAARFFYCAKASKKDRNEGLDGFDNVITGSMNGSLGETMTLGAASLSKNKKQVQPKKNFHPTVKPTDLMRYLCRLVTPPGGTVLDPFMGSGSTGKAAVLEGFNFIGIDLDADYCKIAEARIKNVLTEVDSEKDNGHG